MGSDPNISLLLHHLAGIVVTYLNFNNSISMKKLATYSVLGLAILGTSIFAVSEVNAQQAGLGLSDEVREERIAERTAERQEIIDAAIEEGVLTDRQVEVEDGAYDVPLDPGQLDAILVYHILAQQEIGLLAVLLVGCGCENPLSRVFTA